MTTVVMKSQFKGKKRILNTAFTFFTCSHCHTDDSQFQLNILLVIPSYVKDEVETAFEAMGQFQVMQF